jgi:hypothetical protein
MPLYLAFCNLFKTRRLRTIPESLSQRCFPEILLSLEQFDIMMSATAAEEAALIIRRSLQREIGLLETKKRLTQKEIDELERRNGMNSAEFMREFEQGKLGDSQDCFEWWGLLRGMRAIEDEIKKAKAVLTS